MYGEKAYESVKLDCPSQREQEAWRRKDVPIQEVLGIP